MRGGSNPLQGISKVLCFLIAVAFIYRLAKHLMQTNRTHRALLCMSFFNTSGNKPCNKFRARSIRSYDNSYDNGLRARRQEKSWLWHDRSERDSNPRYNFLYTRLAIVLFRPLRHHSLLKKTFSVEGKGPKCRSSISPP